MITKLLALTLFLADPTAVAQTVGYMVGPAPAILKFPNNVPVDNCVSMRLPCLQQSPSGRFLSLALSADGSTLYAGGYSGVWRSRGGVYWIQLQRPEPCGFDDDLTALMVPNVYDLAVS